MVKVKKDLTGKQFGRLIVVSQTQDYISPDGKHHAQWNCRCDCGNPNIITALGTNLKRGNTTSCGCYRYDKITEKDRGRKINKYNLSGKYGIGWTTNTNEEFYFDLEDYEKIKDFGWYKDNNGYLRATGKDGKALKMHQLIAHVFIDHHNRNKLDNRKENLWECSPSENAQNQSKASNNTSGITGVNWHKHRKKWVARIYNLNKKRISLGYYDFFEEAVKARLQAEKDLYGEFAPQRDLFEQYGIV